MHKSFDFIKNKKTENNQETNKKNIIFLDIDGVIQPYDNQHRFEHDMQETIEYLCEKYQDDIYKEMDIFDVCAAFYDWDEIALGIIAKLLRETNSYLVMHSGWKEYNDLRKFKAMFRFYGLEDYVIDVCNKGDKTRVVFEYLEEHKDEIDEYVVIDDANMVRDFGYHFVHTHDTIKLQNYEHAKKILRSKYTFEEEDGFIVVSSRFGKIFKIPFEEFTIKENNLVYIEYFDYVANYTHDLDYLIAYNHLSNFFYRNDNFGIVVVDKDFGNTYNHISKIYREKRKLDDNVYFYHPLKTFGFKTYDFFTNNYREIAKIVEEKRKVVNN